MTPERRVRLALVRFEVPRLLRRPSMIIGYLATGAALWISYRTTAPALDRDSAGLVARFLPLAGASLIAMHGVGSRPRRGKVEELLAAVPTRSATRVSGEAFALVGPLVLGGIVLGAAMVFLALGDPTGGWRWLELAGVPALLLFGGTLGLALGQWFPRGVSAILTVIALAYVQGWATNDAQSLVGRWFAPIAPVHLIDRFQPYAWQARSPAAHLTWLLALAAVAAVVAILRWERRGTVVASGAVLAGVALLAGGASVRAAQADGPLAGRDLAVIMAELDTNEPELFSVCEHHEPLTFCALPGYEGWIPQWHETVTRITDLVPASATRVVQQPWGGGFVGDADEVVVSGMFWDRSGASVRETFELSAAVGLQSMVTEQHELGGCWLGGQAGGAIGLWLAVQDDEQLAEELRERVASARSGVSTLVSADGAERTIDFAPLWLGVPALQLGVGVAEGEVALAMTALPFSTIEEVVIADIDGWRDPAVSLADLAASLDVAPPPVQDDDVAEEGWGWEACR